jgi:crotonobetainyl-CoA:carnitine CoA-transferase CaiB-like acyl-CoA transferase
MWLRNSVLDVGAGLAGAIGALLGLYRRERTGLPASAETSLLAVGMTIARDGRDAALDGPVPGA